MCCFCLQFSDFIVLFFKTCCSLLFEKNNLLCKKREKITCRKVKSPPPQISNGPSLNITNIDLDETLQPQEKLLSSLQKK